MIYKGLQIVPFKLLQHKTKLNVLTNGMMCCRVNKKGGIKYDWNSIYINCFDWCFRRIL